jgi:hypothetical protein
MDTKDVAKTAWDRFLAVFGPPKKVISVTIEGNVYIDQTESKKADNASKGDFDD